MATEDPMDDKANTNEQSIETLGGVLPDGRTVDLIRDGVTGRLKLLCFDGTQYRTEDRISIEGRTFVPAGARSCCSNCCDPAHKSVGSRMHGKSVPCDIRGFD